MVKLGINRRQRAGEPLRPETPLPGRKHGNPDWPVPEHLEPAQELDLPQPAFRTDPFPSTVAEHTATSTPQPAPRWPRRLAIVVAAIVVLLLLIAISALSAQEPPRPRPAGVTDSAIAWGRALYNGSANCIGCHGSEGRGTDRGPNLTGGIWFHGPGTYEWLIQQVIHGVPADKSVSGEAMPMRGWVPMNDTDVRAVAAYVWSISHPPQPPPKPQPVPGIR